MYESYKYFRQNGLTAIRAYVAAKYVQRAKSDYDKAHYACMLAREFKSISDYQFSIYRCALIGK